MNFKDVIKQPEYEFLHDPSKIRGTLCYLTASGSYAYGTNNENSDLDIRGVAIEDRDELLLGKGMEQYEDKGTDTVVYGLQKYVSICRNCNPNALEMLGTRSEHVLYMDAVGQLLPSSAEGRKLGSGDVMAAHVHAYKGTGGSDNGDETGTIDGTTTSLGR